MIAWLSELHLVATASMIGVIWFVQLVHYPSFKFIDSATFTEFERFHVRRTSLVVAPLMLVEVVTGGVLLFSPTGSFLFQLSMVLLVLVWALTFVVLVPLHHQLEQGKAPEKIERLLYFNRIRAVLWTLAAFLAHEPLN